MVLNKSLIYLLPRKLKMASMLMNSLRSGPVTSVQAARFGKTARVSAELMNTSFYAATEKYWRCACHYCSLKLYNNDFLCPLSLSACLKLFVLSARLPIWKLKVVCLMWWWPDLMHFNRIRRINTQCFVHFCWTLFVIIKQQRARKHLPNREWRTLFWWMASEPLFSYRALRKCGRGTDDSEKSWRSGLLGSLSFLIIAQCSDHF